MSLTNLKYKTLFASFLVFAGLAVIYLLISGSILPGKASASVDLPLTGNEISIPAQEDWIDIGPILELGQEGEWDYVLGGHTPAGIIKKDGIYYFYYVAGDGYRSFDDGPRNRAIGVATSLDGINFVKYQGNPIMTYSPFDGEEEGANSAGITLDEDGNFVMYYGAAEGPHSVITANGRAATAPDGLNFTDHGVVLNRLNPLLYGFGDEIFPLAAYTYQGKWYVYYQPNGAMNSLTLGLAWGSRFDQLPNSTGVLDETSGGLPVHLWGNITWISPDRIALFIQRLWWPDSFVEIRLASPDAPHLLSEPVERYDIPDLKRAVVHLDHEKKTWFMYYNLFDPVWRLMLAPAGEPDRTPPSAPAKVLVCIHSDGKASLLWLKASDADTGIAVYNVYQNGSLIGSTRSLYFPLPDYNGEDPQSFSVSAVNLHGTEGPQARVDQTLNYCIYLPSVHR
jgi:hypothetical protein